MFCSFFSLAIYVYILKRISFIIIRKKTFRQHSLEEIYLFIGENWRQEVSHEWSSNHISYADYQLDDDVL